MYGLGEGPAAIRVLGAGSPMVLSLRPVPDPGTPTDPLHGREVWHTVTDTTVLAGPRSPAGAVRLIDQLRCPTLTRMRQRLIAATHDAPGEPSATAQALGTLLQWPERTRTTLVGDVACAVDAAFQGSVLTDRPEASRTLGWVLALALAYPGDPLALAPLLLRGRRLPAGSSFVLPPGWPFARLTGAAVGVAAGESEPLRARLGRRHDDPDAWMTALERPARIGQGTLPERRRTSTRSAPVVDAALERAFDLARQVSALHPQLATSQNVVDLRDRVAGGPRTAGLPRLLHPAGGRRGIG